MEKVWGGRFMAYTCSCHGDTVEWFYTGEDRPSQGTINADIANYCTSGSGSCLWKAYDGDMPPVT